MSKTIKNIENLIKKEAGEYDWKLHINPVRKHALDLAKKFGADKNIVELGALLHDIGRLRFGPEKHGLTGVPEAEKILKKQKISKDIIEKVLHCVKTHSNKEHSKPETLEAKIIANADAMAHFDSFPYLLYKQAKDKDFYQALSWVEKKMDKNWNSKLFLPEAKKQTRKKYEAVKEMIECVKLAK